MKPRDRDARIQSSAQELGSALKNLTIYPPNHPRVQASAATFIERLRALDLATFELSFHEGALSCNGEPIENEHHYLRWLEQRFRETGLRGVRILPDAQADDVVTFATALRDCRKGTGQALIDTWDTGIEHLQPIPLVLDEVRTDGEGTQPRPNRDQQFAANLRAVAEQQTVRSLLSAIEAVGAPAQSTDSEVDLIGAIAELLPAGAPCDAPSLQRLIEGILGSTLSKLHALNGPEGRVRSSERIRTAIQVAQGSGAPSATIAPPDAPPPAGRPEDDGINADRGALLAEYDTLPEDPALQLPPAEVFDTASDLAAAEIAGVLLHGVARIDQPLDPEQCSRLATLLRDRPSCRPLLDAYLGPASEASPAARSELLHALLEHGLHSLVQQQGYLDDALLVACYPRSLALAALSPPDEAMRGRVADALRHLAQCLGPRMLHELAETHLRDPAVVQLLLRVDGPIAMGLLAHCDQRASAVREVLLQGLRRADGLHELVRAALRALAAEAVPAAWLRRVLRCRGQRSFDHATLHTAGALLREHIQTNRKQLDLGQLLPAIRALRHAPCPESRQLLRNLARSGFASLSARKRAIRRDALLVLAIFDVTPNKSC